MRTVFITGATGVMGMASLKEFDKHKGNYRLRLLVRDSKRNHKKLRPWLHRNDVTIIWGDLLNPDDVAKGLGDADIVLHMGGMVSPSADYFPEKTLKVNVEGTRNVVKAVCRRQDVHPVSLVYIGSVAETSHRDAPAHRGRVGDPVITGEGDHYGLSKILAERLVIDGSVKRWVVLRQSGILHGGLFTKVDNPTMFHVPLRGVLEWTTIEDSGRLMERVCRENVPESFWNNFYNISSGREYRLTNYEFETLLLNATKCPPPEKVFEPGWFATRNFHGMWYTDADDLEAIIPFRKNIPVKEYFKYLAKNAPWWISLSVLAPSPLIKLMMKKVANTPGLGTLYWVKNASAESDLKLMQFFGGRQAQKAIGGWDSLDISRPDDSPNILNHGYDESKPERALDITDMQQVASFRGGKCLSNNMLPGDLDTPLKWECAFGHKFEMSSRIVLKGGHWCGECLPRPWRYHQEARHNPFMAQVWYAAHRPDEQDQN